MSEVKMSKEKTSLIRGIKRFTLNLTHLKYSLFKHLGSFWRLHFITVVL